MSENKRSVDDVRIEYSKLCTKAGHLQYQITTLSKELEVLNGSLRDLNLEAAKLASEEKKNDSQG